MKKQISALMLGSLLIGTSARAEFDSQAAAVGLAMVTPALTTLIVGKEIRSQSIISNQTKLEAIAGGLTMVTAIGFADKYRNEALVVAGLSTFLSGLAYFMLSIGK